MNKLKIFLFFSTIIGVLLFIRCNDLDLAPLDAISEDAFYKTASDFTGAILASYSSMQSLNATSTENLGECAEWWKMTLMATDEVDQDPANDACAGNIQMDNLQFLPTDKTIQSVFTHLYQGIFRANLVIDKLGGEHELTADEIALFEAEAKFMRAWNQFQSYKIWGGQAPLVQSVRGDLNDIALGNSTAAETVAALIADFTDAAAVLPQSWDAGNLGRATSGAALGYLGKTHLYAGNYAEAATIFGQIYNSGVYALMPTFEEALAIDQENSVESLFEIQWGVNGGTDENAWVLDDNHSENFKASQGWLRSWWQDADNARGAPSNSFGVVIPSKEMVDAFEEGDPRRVASIYVEGDTYYTYGPIVQDYDPAWSITGSNIRKYRGENVLKFAPSPEVNDYNNDRLMRYADVLLMYAEALLEMGDAAMAASLINEVRARSFPEGAPVDASGDVKAALIHERRVELAFEGHRLFDIVRWGIAQEVFSAQGKTFTMAGSTAIFPLPQSEIDRSGGKLSQVQ